MNLRDRKRTGGYLTQSPAVGQWSRFGPGELARCPMPDCNRGLAQAGLGTVVMVRVAMEGIGEPGEPCAFLICGDGRCKARLQVRVVAEGEPKVTGG